MILEYLAGTFGTIGALSNVFQVIKIFKRKSAKDISITSYSILLSGSVVWILYGWKIDSWPILLTNGIMFCNLFLIVLGWFLYGRTAL